MYVCLSIMVQRSIDYMHVCHSLYKVRKGKLSLKAARYAQVLKVSSYGFDTNLDALRVEHVQRGERESNMQ